eukprot:1156580-Pelagomonas_calceolata.AAC.11
MTRCGFVSRGPAGSRSAAHGAYGGPAHHLTGAQSADIATAFEGGEGGGLQQQQQQQQQHMLLNGAALENLEVLENAEGLRATSLFAAAAAAADDDDDEDDGDLPGRIWQYGGWLPGFLFKKLNCLTTLATY